ncbi:MAG: aspartate 1-decarboxylase [Planctomycetes bacterium]|nr:aspartate 1-decarboxylase [Planctomycetota bacterium]
MLIEMLKSKIHRATVTEANLNYIGSLTVDKALIEAANMRQYEKVQVVNLNTGARAETYLIEGKKNTGVICLNGGMARMGEPGDKILVLTFCHMEEEKAEHWKPKVILLNEKNKVNSRP